MKSHAILRTNTGLTTNVKLVVGSNYELYLDCIDSSPELNSVRYKKQRVTKDHYWDEVVPKFFRNTPVDVSYKVKYDGDNSTMFKDFSKQYDDLYLYGARNINDNKDYSEEFEYFAPLHITKSSLPTHFIIFRIDGPGLLELTKDNWKVEYLDKMKVVKIFDLTPSSELGEFIKKNITDNTNYPVTSLDIDFNKLEFSYFIGIDYETGGYTRRSQMLENIFSKEKTFYDMEKFIYDSFKTNQIIYPHIINFSYLFDDTPATPSSLRKWSINRYSGFYLNKLEFVTSYSPNILPMLKTDTVILKGNIIQTPTGDSPFVDDNKVGEFPYVELDGKFYQVQKFVEFGDEVLTRVMTSQFSYADRYVKSETIKYKIISETPLIGLQSRLNLNFILFRTINEKVILLQAKANGDAIQNLQIPNFDKSDVWLIEIGDLYHKIIKNSDGDIQLVTDYGFVQSENKFEYYINESDSSFRKSISLTLSEYQGPILFKIYRCEFTDIKDWDTDIVETNFARYEYEESEFLTETDEPKLIMTNLNSTSDPKDYDDYIVGNVVVNVPVASEYTLNHELFRLIEDDLNPLWRKNAERVKWGFQNSLSDSDYPYLLNNNLLADNFNKTVNPYDRELKRIEKNLDYFYSINSDSTDYINQTLHIQPTLAGQLISNYRFDVLKYVDSKLDYFTYFFGQRTEFGNGSLLKNTYKWSYFNPSDGNVTNTTLFRGIKFKIHEVTGISINDGKLENLNLKLTNQFDDYKFSILFSENNNRVEPDTVNPNKGVTQSFINNMRWSIIDEWKMDKTYYPNENVLWNGILYRCQIENKITDPRKNPFTESIDYILNPLRSQVPSVPITQYPWIQIDMFRSSEFQRRKVSTLLTFRSESQTNIQDVWHPFRIIPHITYRDGEFYESINPGKFPINTVLYSTIDFWFPRQTNPVPNENNSYAKPLKVIFKDKIWASNFGTNASEPKIRYYNLPNAKEKDVMVTRVLGVDKVTFRDYWSESTYVEPPSGQDGEVLYWQKVSLWDSTKTYGRNYDVNFDAPQNPADFLYDLVVYDNVLYGATGLFKLDSVTTNIEPTNIPPSVDTRWTRLYSFEPDTNYEYGDTIQRNNVIELNNRYYLFLKDNSAPVPSLGQIQDKTLDQGIIIYINKIFKNILINISVNDNTYKTYVSENVTSLNTNVITSYSVRQLNDYMKGVNRDKLYNDIFSKLSANNFMNALNDLNNKYGFVNSVKYVIIEANSEIKIYDFNNLESGKNLPYFISCEGPDEFFVQNKSVRKQAVNLDENILKPKYKLQNGAIKSINELNYVGDVPIANTIEDEKIEQNPIPNFSGLKNNIYTSIYRHSGFYSPIFKNIELFTAFTETENLGNYKFDTTLTEFGMSGERIVSKINRNQNVLKLGRLGNQKSIYPMLDETGYQITKSFIFKSTWDFKFHRECVIPFSEDNKTSKVLKSVNTNRENSNNL